MKPRILTALLAGTFAVALLTGAPSVAAADEQVSCDVVASPTGSDAAPGTIDQPVRTVAKVLSILPQGGTGCFRAGTYAGDQQIKVSASSVTLTSYPGENATLQGRLWLAGDHDTVTDLSLNGVSDSRLPSPSVSGDDAVISNDDITNDNTGICVSLGALGYGQPDGTVIENNRIHDCGRVRPVTNQDHGIYVAYATNTEISGNYIYDNADRGIQLYPHAMKTNVDGNIIDGNGEGVIFGGDSSHNVVTDNIISDSQVRYNVEYHWDNGVVGNDNTVTNNCVWNGEQGNVLEPEVGYTATHNIVAKPTVPDAKTADFTVSSDDPCAAVTDGQTPPVEDPPGGGPIGSPPPHLGIGLHANRRQISTRHPVKLRGAIHNGTTRTGRAVIESRHHGHWRRIAWTHIRAGQSFTARIHILGHRRSKRSFRAVVPGVGHSKPVHVKVKRR
jgi:parallel beta-helix repeat protein